MCDNGMEADVDFAAYGSEVFNLWRLRRHGLSLPQSLDVTDEHLRAAVRSLQPLLADERPGWFSVAG
ncbi:hypothetical protein [Streptomyces sp. NPDC053755]|uniref:hypothetical protein n=1 Tax=Streptomyces sp. NPDC053755 TaxID=3155815 RepID=UPI0034379983